MQYLIEVWSHGCFVADYTVDAPDALAAIDQVERLYGEPPEVELATIELEDGHKRHVLLVNNWHGYNFLARRI